MNSRSEHLAKRLAAAREKLGVPQSTVAKVLGVSQKQISDYERGNSPPSEAQVLELEALVRQQESNLKSLYLTDLLHCPKNFEKAGIFCQAIEAASDKPLIEVLTEHGLEEFLKEVLLKVLEASNRSG